MPPIAVNSRTVWTAEALSSTAPRA
ncbi:hypothetical protein BDFB_012585 [Asbolus verrucosus]|uniref:Uncharacterized protein n=1 Tax=Asbolus verrucosus TaxID=1661398 RepID=A0A482VD86_ASBVE|nr:hypothetical protein BDFB_012585 [Asbolus verrucosus]